MVNRKLNFKFKHTKILKPKRVVILGSSGIISTNLQKKLKKIGFNFITIGRTKINLKKKNSQISLAKQIKKDDVILFISAEAPVKNIEMFMNNLKICNNVCKGLKGKKIKQMIYISSDAVYSDIRGKISESSPTSPLSMHGLMHLTRETILINSFLGQLCILRPTLIYGVEDTHFGYGPNRFIKLASKNQPLKIFGNGEEKRDHIFIDNMIEIIIKCIQKSGFGILNIASGKVYSFFYLAKLIKNITKSNSQLIKIERFGPMPHNGYRPFNIKRLKKNFKDLKISSIESGLKNYFERQAI